VVQRHPHLPAFNPAAANAADFRFKNSPAFQGFPIMTASLEVKKREFVHSEISVLRSSKRRFRGFLQERLQ
jgi:hypothetical protein